MKLLLNRYLLTRNYTMGKMYIDGILICDTLEDIYRGQNLKNAKLAGCTCIPCGTYKVIMSQSRRLKELLPEVLNVPYFTGIRIHAGNSIADTAGCILVGTKADSGYLKNSRDAKKYIVNTVKQAFDAAEEIELTVQVAGENNERQTIEKTGI